MPVYATAPAAPFDWASRGACLDSDPDVMHIGWVPNHTSGYRGQMAVLVKPNSLLGTGYMAVIAPLGT